MLFPVGPDGHVTFFEFPPVYELPPKSILIEPNKKYYYTALKKEVYSKVISRKKNRN